MSLENIILEIFGIFILTGIPFFLLHTITISPITLPFKNFLNDLSNDKKIFILPLMIYVFIRIYCILISYISDFIDKKVTLIKPQWTRFTMLGLVGFIYFRDASVQSLLSNILHSYFGNLPEVIYQSTKNDFQVVCQYGVRLICVITFWWIVILSIEQCLGYILKCLGYILSASLNSLKPIYLIIFKTERVDGDKKSD